MIDDQHRPFLLNRLSLELLQFRNIIVPCVVEVIPAFGDIPTSAVEYKPAFGCIVAHSVGKFVLALGDIAPSVAKNVTAFGDIVPSAVKDISASSNITAVAEDKPASDDADLQWLRSSCIWRCSDFSGREESLRLVTSLFQWLR